MSREGHKGLTSVYRRWIGLPTLFEINWRLNVRRIMKRVRRAIFLPALLLLVLPAESNSAAEANALKLLISLEQQSVTAPFPARITLHLHNSGQRPLWLYRKARDASTAFHGDASRLESEERATAYTSGGSTVAVQLAPAEAREIATPAQGTVLDSVGMPHPKLIRLDPGEDYEEKAVVRVSPALIGTSADSKPAWGRYHFSIVYAAKFSNGEEVERNIGVALWQGEVGSNTLEVELLPPTAQGSVSGPALGTDSRPVPGVLVSLSDAQERVLDQALTDTQGRFSFTHLPFGLYWVTARRVGSPVDTAVFRHVELTPSAPAGTVELPLLPSEVYEPKQMLHKPVLLRVVDSAGHPAGGVTLEIAWSSGTVLDNVKARAAEDGTAAVERLLQRLTDVPTPAGLTPRQFAQSGNFIPLANFDTALPRRELS